MSAVQDLIEPAIDAAVSILRDEWTGILGHVSKVGAALQETGRRMKNWRDNAPGGNGLPPTDFGMDEVHAMILRGEAPPSAWRPFMKALNFSEEKELHNLSAVSGLSALKVLYLGENPNVDVSVLDHLQRLAIYGGPAPREGKPRPE